MRYEHVMGVYNPPELVFDHGEGVYLYTEGGEKYLDCISGIAVNCLGHADPDVIEALNAQAQKIWHLSNMFKVTGQKTLSDKYCEAAEFADKVFFTNSGAEAVECAIKTARRCQFIEGKPEKYEILTFQGAFHGRTMGTINAGGNPKYLEGFGPKMEGFTSLPFGDHEALQDAIGPNTGAILVEPVQGEGGVRALPTQCLRGLRELCDEHDLLLIYDEVQCGAGRTGKMFAYQWAEGGEPDVMALAKGIGGGFPLGACLASKRAAEGMVPGTHGSTYGGNPLAMAVGNVVFDKLNAPGFLESVEKTANFFTQQLEGLKDRHPDVVKDVRGKGMLIGMQLKKNPVEIKNMARDENLLIGNAGNNVLRMAPPLILNVEQAREAVEALDRVFTKAKDLPDV